jgi:hypothetical protein
VDLENMALNCVPIMVKHRVYPWTSSLSDRKGSLTEPAEITEKNGETYD